MGKSQKPENREPPPTPPPHLHGPGTQGRGRSDPPVPSFSLPSAPPYQSLKVKAQSNQQRWRPWGRPRLPAPAGMECSVSHLSGQRDLPDWPPASVGTQRPRLHCSPRGGSKSGLRNAGVAYQIKGSVSTPPWSRREKAVRIFRVHELPSSDWYGPHGRPRGRRA